MVWGVHALFIPSVVLEGFLTLFAYGLRGSCRSFIPNREGIAVRVSLELMEVTGVSFHMWKVNVGMRQKRGW